MKKCIVSAVTLCLAAAGCSGDVYNNYCETDQDARTNDPNTQDDASTPGSDGGGSEPGSDAGAPDDSGNDPSDDGGTTTPAAPWVNVTHNLVDLAAGGGDISIISAQPGSSRVIAGIANDKGLFASDDGGATWFALGMSSEIVANYPMAIVYDPTTPTTYWEAGIYGSGGGVYKTTDNGANFTRLGTVGHNDLVSVDFTDPARKLLLAGSHERSGILWQTTDGGENWTDVGARLPTGAGQLTLPLVIDSNTFLIGGTSGAFRSENAGQTWTRVSSQTPSGRPLWAKDGTMYWVLGGNAMIVSSDNGKTWTAAGMGPVRMFSGGPTELPDGRVVTLGFENLLITADKGKTWKKVGAKLPYPGANCGIYGFTYSAGRKEFFLNHNDCMGHILDDAVFSAPFDWESN